MRLVEENLGTTYLGETEITWIKVYRVFESQEEKKQYDWQRFEDVMKDKSLVRQGN
jgi:hypothetical protein